MARKKRRFEQLQAAAATPKERKIYTNKIQEQANERLDEFGKRLEGKGRTILYGLGAVVVVLILVFFFVRWNRSSSGAAQFALGQAIQTSQAPVTETDPPAGSTTKTFKTEKARAEASIAEFQAVVDKFGGDVADKARYFIAVNKLTLDRPAGIQELEAIANTTSPAGKLAKFALAQTRVDDKRYDDAVAIFQELLALENSLVAKDTLNFEIAKVYELQDKKAEAADIYFNIAKAGAERKDMDGKAVAATETITESKKRLEELNPARAKELPTPEGDAPTSPGSQQISLGG